MATTSTCCPTFATHRLAQRMLIEEPVPRHEYVALCDCVLAAHLGDAYPLRQCFPFADKVCFGDALNDAHRERVQTYRRQLADGIPDPSAMGTPVRLIDRRTVAALWNAARFYDHLHERLHELTGIDCRQHQGQQDSRDREGDGSHSAFEGLEEMARKWCPLQTVSQI